MGAAVVVLREGFEASLVVGIILAFLRRTGRSDAVIPVWAGVVGAVLASGVIGGILLLVGAELEGRAEAIWEGVTMLAAAGLLTWMVLWMRRQSHRLRSDLERRTQSALARGSALGLALVAFVGVVREGVETALFLAGSTAGSSPLAAIAGATAGLVLAVLLGWAFYRGSDRLNLRLFFTLTGAMLLVFAGWLLAAGLHELAAGRILPDSGILLSAAFALLAAPALYAFFRPAHRRPAA
jgi:high-affinity iron transporter